MVNFLKLDVFGGISSREEGVGEWIAGIRRTIHTYRTPNAGHPPVPKRISEEGVGEWIAGIRRTIDTYRSPNAGHPPVPVAAATSPGASPPVVDGRVPDFGYPWLIINDFEI